LVNIALLVLLILPLPIFANAIYLTTVVGLSVAMSIVLVLMFIWAFAPLLIFQAVLRRKNYGRYLTVLFLAFHSIMTFRNLLLFLIDPSGHAVYVNSLSEGLGLWALNIFQLTLLPLAIAFAVNKNVSAYFGFKDQIDGHQFPPPPPTFDVD